MSAQKATINLASQPFGRERIELAVLLGLCSVLLISALVFTTLIIRDRHKASALRRTIRTEQQQVAALERQQNQFQTVIARPSNVDVFSKSVFYNELIAHRAVSWTRVFEDLEHIMPPNIQLVSLRLPQVTAENESGKSHIQLVMVVGTQRPEAIAALFSKLQESSLFGAAEMSSQQPPTQNDPLYRFQLSVPYVQKL